MAVKDVSFWGLGDIGPIALDQRARNNGVYVSIARQGVEKLSDDSPDPAAQFDGTDSRVEIPDSTDLRFTSQFTIECVLKPKHLNTIQPIVAKYTPSNGLRSYKLGILPSGELQFYVSGDGTVPVIAVSSGAGIRIGRAHFISVVFDRGTVVFYVNGKSAGIANLSVSDVFVSPQQFYIGRWS
jgi:hypothetical protein